ncbi:Ku protein [Starkeya sp. ORNL1]|uniref:non-homologous end joining protein Ku n=1 Tax=Starkeya sp. ORNL1 TaxID=2709380 RepID=UPI0014643DC0|nr:Ku protein [Starkeya sp. ORNL1]QJP13282.1 Ku protein [Starkeya sp. ORNL1]
MAPRSFWKGYLKLSLVTCPVQMSPATSDREKIKFHTLNRATGHRLVTQMVDAETGEPVEEDEEVKGYERGENEYVLLDDAEIEAVALESTRTINIETFVPKDSISWIWYDRPHYLKPDDPVGEEAFSVIRDAMAATEMVGISRLVMYRRERAVMLEPRDKGIVLWTLRYGDEVRDPANYFGSIGEDEVDKDLLSLGTYLVKEKTGRWDEKSLNDPVQDRLQDLINAKLKGRKPVKQAKEEEPERPANVVSILDALRKSVETESKGKTKRR